MNKRKLLGTILGIIFWTCCISFFTFAYYEWKSDNTNVVLGIQDLTTKCIPGTDVTVNNIGPVLDYKDGAKAQFSIENQTSKVMAIDLRLDITSISDNLKTESFKYAIVTDTTGGTNYDYNNPVFTESFTNFEVGSNVIMTDLTVSASITQNFLFIVYIDGNMYNNPNMQENSLVANLMIGNCEENSLPMDSLIYQAIYSADDNSLTFVHTTQLTAGDTYNNKAVTSVYTGFETTTYQGVSAAPWANDDSITNVTFEAVVSPVSTAFWFASLPSVTTMDLTRLDTSNVTNMEYMFYNCTNLTSLDVSNFNTSKVTNMKHMFENLNKITNLNIENFDTSNVTEMTYMFCKMTSLQNINLANFDTSKVTRMDGMFESCSSLTSLDVGGFNTTNVENMSFMFRGCTSLTNIDLSSFNTSKVTLMTHMFYNCINLLNLDLNNFNTEKVTSMEAMFSDCFNLININMINFDTSNVVNMDTMFYKCNNLTTVITIMNTETTSYKNMFTNAATADGALITVNYIGDNSDTEANESTEELVGLMVDTKSNNSNVKVGECVDCAV